MFERYRKNIIGEHVIALNTVLLLNGPVVSAYFVYHQSFVLLFNCFFNIKFYRFHIKFLQILELKITAQKTIGF